jgi:hypothetical protein
MSFASPDPDLAPTFHVSKTPGATTVRAMLERIARSARHVTRRDRPPTAADTQKAPDGAADSPAALPAPGEDRSRAMWVAMFRDFARELAELHAGGRGLGDLHAERLVLDAEGRRVLAGPWCPHPDATAETNRLLLLLEQALAILDPRSLVSGELASIGRIVRARGASGESPAAVLAALLERLEAEVDAGPASNPGGTAGTTGRATVGAPPRTPQRRIADAERARATWDLYARALGATSAERLGVVPSPETAREREEDRSTEGADRSDRLAELRAARSSLEARRRGTWRTPSDRRGHEALWPADLDDDTADASEVDRRGRRHRDGANGEGGAIAESQRAGADDELWATPETRDDRSTVDADLFGDGIGGGQDEQDALHATERQGLLEQDGLTDDLPAAEEDGISEAFGVEAADPGALGLFDLDESQLDGPQLDGPDLDDDPEPTATVASNAASTEEDRARRIADGLDASEEGMLLALAEELRFEVEDDEAGDDAEATERPEHVHTRDRIVAICSRVLDLERRICAISTDDLAELAQWSEDARSVLTEASFVERMLDRPSSLALCPAERLVARRALAILQRFVGAGDGTLIRVALCVEDALYIDAAFAGPGHADVWTLTNRVLAVDSRFGPDAHVRPVRELTPLGPSRETGAIEFLHRRTGLRFTLLPRAWWTGEQPVFVSLQPIDDSHFARVPAALHATVEQTLTTLAMRPAREVESAFVSEDLSEGNVFAALVGEAG